MRIVYQIPDRDYPEDFTLTREHVIDDGLQDIRFIPRVGDHIDIDMHEHEVTRVVWEDLELSGVVVVLKP
ncbi:hypothetical protein SEA_BRUTONGASTER_133 [Gordonia phage BrutonGaster]|uniref:Uncharacterized protein n=1 Tax=Gordonia phage BrutonGaster TaxID=2530116 RepID=A0A482JLU2_9CAUD|nr:hypothetical protein HOV26_gp049 [Gordonia phage BrutonGaster]QBP33347.1 hypothetical protein SEA_BRUTONGASTER_133 [Gordonia phage BrutonGaster]